MESEKLEFFRALLKSRLAALLTGSSAEIRDRVEVREPVADDIDVAALESNREFTLRLRDRERVLIDKIREALGRIDSGEYGDCVVCGDPIPERRLLARPVATHCVDCKTEAEQLERRSRAL